jgi:ABC-type multidrug transport system fused ATPase/permease subunit
MSDKPTRDLRSRIRALFLGESAADASSGGVFSHSGRALKLVWETNPGLTIAMALVTLALGLIPASVAWVGKLIVDGVLAAVDSGDAADRWAVLGLIAVEGGLVAVRAALSRGQQVCDSLLRVQLGHRVNVLILERAVDMELPELEDSDTYDRMTQARRGASSRPLGLVRKLFRILQSGISLTSYAGLLLVFSPWLVLLLAVASLPEFLAETRFAGDAFRLFRWRSPESRKQMYLETVLAREDYAKEVKVLDLGPTLLQRYRDIFQLVYAEDRDLTLRRGGWGYVLGLLSTGSLYGAYGWIAWSAVDTRISLGEMTMYLMVFKQGLASFGQVLSSVGQMVEDNLYLANLFEFLDAPSAHVVDGAGTEGPNPGDGLRFEGVSFSYPGSDSPAIVDLDLHLSPGTKLALVGHNGSGKTTLVKLLTGLYQPQQGRILLDGLPLGEWDPAALRRRIGVIFQDFVRYQFTLGENIGVGDVDNMDDPERRDAAAHKGMADSIADELPDGYGTQLGRWFRAGRELSGGQWQKVALSRAFMRPEADVLVLDEPTSAMDAQAEAEVFQRVRRMAPDQMAVLISHRFSTVRMADHIVVLDGGRIVEQGAHHVLMEQGGEYARLFELQAAGYR